VGGVTISLQADFVAPVSAGQSVHCSGKVARAGRSVMFLQGEMTVSDEVVLIFTGIIKRVSPPQRRTMSTASFSMSTAACWPPSDGA
jgi:acyl-coenzyme A thioesterase PaaI-like protein